MQPRDTRSNTFETAVLSEAGGRESNQDSCRWQQLNQHACWAIADGVGGHRGGAVAAKTAVESVLESFAGSPECSRDALQIHIAAAQEALQQLQQRSAECAKMRTTLAVLLVDEEHALWGHIGDSRLYRFRSQGLIAQTEDHSVPQALVSAGDISPDSIRDHRDRNRLLRSLGEPGPARPTILERAVDLCPGDAFLLCTDGFWEHVLENQMLADLAASSSPEAWLKRLESRLFRRVSGAYDNYSALAVFYGNRA